MTMHTDHDVITPDPHSPLSFPSLPSQVNGTRANDLHSSLDNPHRQLYLHYGFAPFSTNEVAKLGAPGRREVGHGNLAERALLGETLMSCSKWLLPLSVTSNFVHL